MIFTIVAVSNTGTAVSVNTPQYWAPIFTFIVGIVGIISQIAVNFFLENRKRKLEEKKDRKENILNYYTPLLVLIRRYSCNRELLMRIPNFRIGVQLMEESENEIGIYRDLIGMYSELLTLLQKGYVPMNKELDLEINKLLRHVIVVQHLLTSILGVNIGDILPEDEQQGYDCTHIEKLLNKEIFKC